MLRPRTISLRAFDNAGMIVGAELCEGIVLEEKIEALFADENAAYIHLHYAKRGCFACQVNRADG